MILEVFLEFVVLMNFSNGIRELVIHTLDPRYAKGCRLYDLILAALLFRLFGFNDERSGLAGVYTVNISDR